VHFFLVWGCLQDGVRPRGEHVLAGGAAVPGRVRHRGHQGEIPSLPLSFCCLLRSGLAEGWRAVPDSNLNSGDAGDAECLCGLVGTFVTARLDLWGWLLLRELKSERGAVGGFFRIINRIAGICELGVL